MTTMTKTEFNEHLLKKLGWTEQGWVWSSPVGDLMLPPDLSAEENLHLLIRVADRLLNTWELRSWVKCGRRVYQLGNSLSLWSTPSMAFEVYMAQVEGVEVKE
jgi:hypothetical protein